MDFIFNAASSKQLLQMYFEEVAPKHGGLNLSRRGLDPDSRSRRQKGAV
jgi:hypothetical protein